MSGKLKGFRVDNVDIGGRNGQNQTVWLGDVFGNEGSRLLLDVGGLISNGNLIFFKQFFLKELASFSAFATFRINV